MRNGQTADFVIEKSGRQVLQVEARNITSPSPDFAAEFLRDLFAVSGTPLCDYFLLALRNRLYLWRHPSFDISLADFEADTSEVLKSYLTGLRRPLDQVHQSTFEFVVQSWLGDLAAGDLRDAGDQRWLEESGLAKAVRDGYIRTNIAA
jgi:hypothetical protein